MRITTPRSVFKKTVFDKLIYLGFSQTVSAYLDTDSFVLSFDANNQDLTNFLQQRKDEFDFSDLDKSYELFDTNKKNIMK